MIRSSEDYIDEVHCIFHRDETVRFREIKKLDDNKELKIDVGSWCVN